MLSYCTNGSFKWKLYFAVRKSGASNHGPMRVRAIELTCTTNCTFYNVGVHVHVDYVKETTNTPRKIFAPYSSQPRSTSGPIKHCREFPLIQFSIILIPGTLYFQTVSLTFPVEQLYFLKWCHSKPFSCSDKIQAARKNRFLDSILTNHFSTCIGNGRWNVIINGGPNSEK